MNALLRNLGFGLLTAVIVLGFSALLGEGIVRVFLKEDTALFPRYVTGASYGDYQIRRNLPGARYRHTSMDGQWEFRINSKGLRSDREFSYEKPAGTVRILALGDSFTIGYEVLQEQSYPELLERLLRQKGYAVEVINAGVSGFSNAEALVFLEQEGKKYQPDIVTLGFFENDLEDNVRTDLYRLRDGKLQAYKKTYLPAIRQSDRLNAMPVIRWLSENSFLYNYLNRAAALFLKKKFEMSHLEEITKQGNASVSADQYRNDLAYHLVLKIYETAKNAGAYFVLMDIPNFRYEKSFPEGYSKEKAADAFVDALDILQPYRSSSTLYRQHGNRHWAEKSHEIMAAHLAEVLEPVIKEKQAAL
jgi:lysophospholipase L1-like esterase